jgi:DNA modification methylase
MIAKAVLCRYPSKVMLDFTMGWGGRLVAACAMNLQEYIGIDLNTNLKPLYEKMKKTLNSLSDTKMSLHFKDAATFDYSKLDYDLVLTSPPYYNVEIYNKNDVMTEQEWKDKFYIPAFTNTFKHLKKGGHYCLNVPEYIYDDVCVPILGKCQDKMLLGIPDHKRKYNEFIYIWHKK